jgi:membrane associated rhomboid family serine protease
MTVFVLTLIIGLILITRVGIKTLDFVKQSANMKRRMLIALLILFIYFIFLSLLFPGNIVIPDGSVVNIFAHQVGVFFGVILGLCILKWFSEKTS